ncbi:carbohydrate ABC transporter permease [Vineibacter terrae]|uniref:carbohydrate ABC transporter permease n=1 Tax=Vineibacter terrae TaxID=2586908 RepID=UPI002E359A1A|nr:carbohydrate ABC transporter permease [Vineibacter terrae]HEX2886851.1 carbohydrate ABC transporter permease [Vineibacter terrae]
MRRHGIPWLRHAALIVVAALMLLPFYWVLKTAVANENIYAYPPRLLPSEPHLFNFVDVWYLIPFPRYMLNSIIVSALAVAGNVIFNAMAGYALTRHFPGRRWIMALYLSCMLIPFQATIIPAYLVTGRLGLLNSYLGLALPLLSTIVCIFIYKAAFEAVPKSLIDAARIDGIGEWRIIWRILMPLSKPAIASNVILSFIWSWNAFLWPLLIVRDTQMQTLPLGLARFLSYMEDTTGALYAFAVMVLVPSIVVFLMAQKEFIRGLTSGATKG